MTRRRPPGRRIRTAELLSIGSELTVGETRDTNSGDLARSLTAAGVEVLRITALPDRLDPVSAAFRAALERADLVVSTGGLGPTPDDLTREAIAAATGETPAPDPELEAWLRGLWRRRDLPFPEINLKQAWLIPSAVALPNPNGSAPGWYVTRPDGRIVVALPGPPREMHPMWADEAVPRLQQAGLGADAASRTFRLAGIGELQVAELLGEPLLRATNPVVATYARADAVDVRVSAVGDAGHTAVDLVEGAAATVIARLGRYVWTTGERSWAETIGERLGSLGWTLAIVEIGTGGQLATLLGDVPWLLRRESLPEIDRGLDRLATRVRARAGVDVGLAVRARPRRGDTAVSIVVVTPAGASRVRTLAFLDGAQGRHRAALLAADALLRALPGPEASDDGPDAAGTSPS